MFAPFCYYLSNRTIIVECLNNWNVIILHVSVILNTYLYVIYMKNLYD